MPKRRAEAETKSVPRFSNLEVLFASIAAWRNGGSHGTLLNYLQTSWKPKSKRKTLIAPMQRSEEALKLLRRWGLVDNRGDPRVSCLELVGQFESNRNSFWTSLGRLVLREDHVFRDIHGALRERTLTTQEIARLWNPVTADICIRWGRALQLFFSYYENKGRFFAVDLRTPEEPEVRETLAACYAELSTDIMGTRTEYLRIPALVNCAAFALRVGENHVREALVRWAKDSPSVIEFASAPKVSIERKGGTPITFEGRTYYYIRIRGNRP